VAPFVRSLCVAPVHTRYGQRSEDGSDASLIPNAVFGHLHHFTNIRELYLCEIVITQVALEALFSLSALSSLIGRNLASPPGGLNPPLHRGGGRALRLSAFDVSWSQSGADAVPLGSWLTVLDPENLRRLHFSSNLLRIGGIVPVFNQMTDLVIDIMPEEQAPNGHFRRLPAMFPQVRRLTVFCAQNGYLRGEDMQENLRIACGGFERLQTLAVPLGVVGIVLHPDVQITHLRIGRIVMQAMLFRSLGQQPIPSITVLDLFLNSINAVGVAQTLRVFPNLQTLVMNHDIPVPELCVARVDTVSPERARVKRTMIKRK
jgi:hypothetical protein